jgi:hypothetical protein
MRCQENICRTSASCPHFQRSMPPPSNTLVETHVLRYVLYTASRLNVWDHSRTRCCFMMLQLCYNAFLVRDNGALCGCWQLELKHRLSTPGQPPLQSLSALLWCPESCPVSRDSIAVWLRSRPVRGSWRHCFEAKFTKDHFPVHFSNVTSAVTG